MSYLFNEYKSLTNLNKSNFSNKNVNNMSNIFSECKSLNRENIICYNNEIINNLVI